MLLNTFSSRTQPSGTLFPSRAFRFDTLRSNSISSPSAENINPLMCTGNYNVTLNNMKLVHCPFIGRLLHFGTARRGLSEAAAPRPLAVPNVTAHPSTASVPITVLLCNVGGLSVPINWRINVSAKSRQFLLSFVCSLSSFKLLFVFLIFLLPLVVNKDVQSIPIKLRETYIYNTDITDWGPGGHPVR